MHIGKFSAMDYNSNYDVNVNDLFMGEINKKEIIKKYGNIIHITIDELCDSAYIYNLRKLPKLSSLNIGNVTNVLFFDELHYLKKLEYLDMCNGFPATMDKEIYMHGLSQCENLRDLLLCTHLNYFPSELTKLRKLESLYFGFPEINGKNLKKISSKLCKLNNLITLTLHTKRKYVIHKNKMLILNYCKNITIPKNITYLKIINYEDEYINNLPDNIKTLNLSFVNKLPINNLPHNLKKLIICYGKIEYWNADTEDNETKNITINDIKLPYGCELVVKI